jgi:ketosteroid isomerase-like protein
MLYAPAKPTSRECIMGGRASRILILVCAVAVTAFAPRPAAAADDKEIVAEFDRTFLATVARGDKRVAAALFESDFTWTDAFGVTRNKSEALQSLAREADETDVATHFHGRVFTVRGSHQNLRFLRVWVKRNDDWRIFLLLETPVAPRSGTASVEAAAGQGDCDNPCRTVPYVPQTAMDKAILAAWQQTKMIEWKPDADAWARYIADEFMIINNTTIRTRPERIEIARKQQAAGVGAPGDPIMSMEIDDFGDDAAVMISQHVPYRGGKPYRNVRVWALRDGRWQLAISQQSTIQSATPLPPVAAKN